MKKQLLKNAKHWGLTLTGITLLVVNAAAQLSGVKTIPGTYATVSAAISALNSNGVGTGGVTFNIAAGYTETISATLSVTATGTAANPIVFQKSGAGVNPKIISYTGGTGTPASAVQDGIWNFVGSDYVTIDGIDLAENSANTTNPATMEYGYGLFKANTIDGCTNNSIKNCVITLNRNNSATSAGPSFAGSCGIVMLNCTVTNATTSLTILAASGASSNNSFYSNTIQNCNNGIVLSGFATTAPYAFADTNNDIGGNAGSTGNTFINFGGGSSAVNPSAAVVTKDQWSFNISYNTINNNNGSGVNHINALRGIWTNGSPGANGTINNNTLTLSSNGAITQLTAIENNAGAFSPSSNTISIKNNTITNCSYPNATSGGFYGIHVPAPPANTVISGNVFSNNSTAATSGNYSLIYFTVPPVNYYEMGTLSSALILNNTITNTTFTAPSTTSVFRALNFDAISMARMAFTIDTNTVQNVTYNGNGEISAFYFSIPGFRQLNLRNNSIVSNTFNTTNNLYFFNIPSGFPTGTLPLSSACTKDILNNVVNNITRITGTGTTYGIFNNTLSPAYGNIITIANNQFTNIFSGGASAVNIIFETDGITTAPFGPQKLVYNNTISNITCGSGASVMITVSGSTTNSPGKVYNNTISNITGSGGVTGIGIAGTPLGAQDYYNNIITGLVSSGAVTGISLSTGDVTTNAYGNKIYDLTGTGSGSTVTGIGTASGPAGTSTFNIYNNLIADLKTPIANGVNMINGISLAQGTTINIHHNTVALNATSTGANFGTSALNVTATPGTVVLRNNVFVNTSTPNGTGITAASRRASTVLTNFSATSQNNLYSAGPVAYNRTILYDGTNTDSTLAQYKTRVGPIRDSLAINEDVTFLSLNGTSPNFLKPSSAIATGIESGALPIAGLSEAFGNAPRPGNPAYAGLGGLPDLGAIEGDYMGTGVPMTYDSSSVDQISGSVAIGASNAQILRIRVYTQDGGNALNATSFKFTTTGTTSLANITAAKVYSTGSTSTFTNALLYGSVSSPGTTFYVTGSHRLNAGVNYFWLVYDVNSTIATGNLLDASLDSIVLSGTLYPMTTIDTVGSRIAKPRMSGNYDIGVGKTAPDFASINEALSDLAALGVSGPVTFTLTDATYDIATTNITSVPFNITAFDGASPTNTVTLRPAASSNAVISENTANPIFNLSGVNYFIIDGRQGGTGTPKSLTVQNTNAGGNAVTFVNDASNNKLQHAVFKGQTNNVSTAVLKWSTGLVTGNDYNIVNNCDIADNGGSNTPAAAIYSLGSSNCPLNRFNDYNSITNCNIYNFWNPAGETDAIKMTLGNNYWTISGNSFYQTTPRVGTAACFTFNLNNGSDFDALNGIVISGNYIGGSAPQCGGTPWTQTMGGALSSYFLIGGGGNATVPSRFSNNTMANFSFVTNSTAFAGNAGATGGGGLLSLCNLASGKMNIDSNTYGSLTDPNSIVVTGGSGGAILPIFIGTSQIAGTYSISYNKMGGIKVQPAIGNVNGFTGINSNLAAVGTVLNIRKNIIGAPGLNNIAATTSISISNQIVRGIAITGTPTVINIDSNIIQNLSNMNSGTGTGSQVIGISSTGGVNTITNNQIDSLSNASPQTGVGTFASVIGITCTSIVGSTNIGGNTIFGLFNSASSGAVSVTGINFGGSTTGLVQRNFVHTLTSVSPTSVNYGILHNNGNGRLINNMIRMGIDGSGNAVTATPVIYGIIKAGGNMEAYFNSIYIGGNNVGSTVANTFAFSRNAAGTDIVMNNIFANNRSNATTGGEHYAIGLNNTTLLTLNSNIYHSVGTDAKIGNLNGAGILNLSDWKSATGLDASSSSGDPGFANAIGNANTVNLHISGPTPVEGAGIFISGSSTDLDYDGELRSELTPVDIGADGGNFTLNDLTGPAIAYTPLTHSSSTGNRTLTATITDPTGVFLAGSLRPRIYYKNMAAGGYISTQGVLVSGTKTNSVWNFTVNTSLVGLSVTDTLYYYVVAQDSTIGSNNLGSMPSGADGADVNAIFTHATIPNFYVVLPGISGPFNVGTGELFTSLSGSDGLFNYINNSIVSGDITIQITSDIRELGTVGLNQVTESGIGGYKIRVVPNAATERILFSSSSLGMIRLNGADRVTFDGRFAGSGRYLKLIDTSGANLPAFTMQNDAHCDTLMYCTVLGNNSATGDVLFGACTTGTGNDSNAVMYCMLGGIDRTTYNTNTNISCANASVGTENSENTIAYNEFFLNRYGAINLNTTSTGDNWNIYGNTFYMDTIANPTAADHRIIQVQGGGGHTIRKNSIGGSVSDRSGSAYTISTTGTSRSVFGVYISSSSALLVTVDSNTIGNLVNRGTTVSTTVGLYGIYSTTAITNITANTIGNLVQPTDSLHSSNGNIFGIYLAGGTSTVSNNTIANLYNRHAGTVTCAGIYITSAFTTVSSNTIHDVSAVSTTTANFTQIPSGITISAGAHVVNKNIVYNITNVNTGTVAYTATGLSVTGGTFSVISRNRISNISAMGTGTGTSSPQVMGIYNSGLTYTYHNNQVTIGSNASGQTRVYGIMDASTSGTTAYYYNTVFVNGTTLAGSNNSYGILRSNNAPILAWNNIFYNTRTTGGTGTNYAIGNANLNNLSAGASNYNLLVVNDTNKVSEYGSGNSIGAWAYNNTLNTTNGIYNTNWIESTTAIPADSLFTNTLTGNLGTRNDRTHSWYVNGKGCAIAGQNGDFNSTSSVRSVAIVTGSTDIGSMEITPSAGLLPPSATADKIPALNDSTTYSFGTRTIAKIKWGSTGTLPSSLNVKYYSGVNPPNTFAGATYMNAYWNIVPTGGSGYSTSMALLQDSAILGSVSSLPNLKVVRYVGPGMQWAPPLATSVDNASGTMQSTGISSFGIYTGTDGLINPLPVKLLSFKASAINEDVQLLWSTANEFNNTGFAVERSVDGKTFKEINFVKSNGNSNSVINYEMLDPEAFGKQKANVIYYRLRQQDADGSSTYSTVATVMRNAKNITLVAYPNPFDGQVTLKLASATDSEATLTVTDITGKELVSFTKSLTKGNNQLLIEEVSSLHTGIYFLTLQTNGEKQILKLIKQ